MAHIEIIKKINEERLLVTVDGKHAIISHSGAFDAPETVAFWSDETGHVPLCSQVDKQGDGLVGDRLL